MTNIHLYVLKMRRNGIDKIINFKVYFLRKAPIFDKKKVDIHKVRPLFSVWAKGKNRLVIVHH